MRGVNPATSHRYSMFMIRFATNTLELVSIYIERRGISIETKLEPKPVWVKAKAGHLEDVWLNLLLNARDALNNLPGAHISISSKVLSDTVEVTVQDNGPGVPPTNQEQVFNPFFTTKPQGEGTGLGLYICKQITADCGGSMVLDTTIKEGACFRVTLPIVPEKNLTGA
jgi:C4-dicarboxylate-specific signal transduction histidine kinase